MRSFFKRRVKTILFTLFAAWFFFLGVFYIASASSEVDMYFSVAGSPFIAPQTQALYSFAAGSNKKSDFTEFSASANLQCLKPYEVPITKTIDLPSSGEVLFKFMTPNHACELYELQFALHKESGVRQVAKIKLPQSNAFEESEKNKKESLLFEAIPMGTFFPDTSTPVILNVLPLIEQLEPEPIQASIIYGTGTIPSEIAFNALGLAKVNVQVKSETDVHFTLPLKEEPLQRYASYSPLTSNTKLTPLSLPIIAPNEDFHIAIEATGSPTPYYCNIFYNNTWIEQMVWTGKEQRLSTQQFKNTIPQALGILNLHCCQSKWSCGEHLVVQNLLFNPKNEPFEQQIAYLLKQLESTNHREMGGLFQERLSKHPHLTQDEQELVLEYLLQKFSALQKEPQALLHSLEAEKNKLNTIKTEEKKSANMLFFLTLIMGILILSGIVMQMHQDKKRRLLKLWLEDTEGNSEDLNYHPGMLHQIPLILFMAALLIMLAGLYYLFQIL